MFYLDPPVRLRAVVHATLPDRWVEPKASEWANANAGGRALGSFLEGPCFDKNGDLFIVDIPFGRIFVLKSEGRFELYSSYDGWPNGLKIVDDRIIIADHKQGLVQLREGTATVLANGYRGERFRGLNDLTPGIDGWIYITDQGQSGLQEPSGAIYRWRLPTNRLDRILTGVPSPNGLVFDIKRNRLYVAVTRTNAIWRLPFVQDGGTSKVGVFLNLSGGGGPDGLTIDAEGGLVVAQPGLGVMRFNPTGHLTHFVDVPEGASASNITFGRADPERLYITDSAAGRILSVAMPFPGPGSEALR
ncbi:SMP-30/gluconolactonase/LRE family protein [Rhizobium sp. 16-449-1b]|uniref:SMP-30/gluconolactonase/LRE family protein n=1 Tax=Rhizobium sp. 16-449-1b TaxID=2819989 RepID=UPI001ADA3B86|nr:SMP-30/gluconolactonase/LRE family protein [Rhizobium sp. 16-449-1b]MBO9197523.1 SMP-30/gluconolactonase/LRE family protein [Rhizobium sp. 16-449-1b]